MRFQINTNGNSANDINTALQEAQRAVFALERALGRVHADVLHGRNYQTCERGARAADMEELGHHMFALGQLQHWLMSGADEAARQREGL